MGIKDKLLKWFKSKEEDRQESNPDYILNRKPKTEEDIEKIFRVFGLDSKFQLFKPLIRSKIDFDLSPSGDENIKIGQSKIGGKPDLINDDFWPKTNSNKSLSFIGQLNCEDVDALDSEDFLPEVGLISFFYCADQEAWGFDPKDIDRFKVIYTESTHGLKRVDFPTDLENYSRFKPNLLKFERSLSLPGWEHHSVEGLLSDDELDRYLKISIDSENQILGYANCVQGLMELECQLVSNGLYCGDLSGYEDPSRKDLEAGKADWILLFQVNSEEDKAGMMWGDMGRLYFWIRKQDLRNKNFDKCWLILQCG